MPKILVLDPIDPAGLALLRGRAEVDLVHLPEPTEQAIAREIADAWALVLRARRLAPEQWRAARALALVSRHGVGCDNVPLGDLRAAGVTVAITADANAPSVAEHTLMLMLATARRARAQDAAVREGRWTLREAERAGDLLGATLLIVGLGRIGREVAARASAFGMRILGHDPLLDPSERIPGVERAPDLDAGLAEADVVTLHLPAAPGTRGLFDARRLARFKAGSILINAARGGIVDESALFDALDAGPLAGAGLDVFAEEPAPADHPLLARADVLLSPHSAALSRQGARRMAEHAARNVLDFLDGRLDPRMIAAEPGGRRA